MAMEQRIVEPIVDKIDTFLAQKKPIVTIHEENLEIDARSGDVAWPLCVRLSSWKNVRPLE